MYAVITWKLSVFWVNVAVLGCDTIVCWVRHRYALQLCLGAGAPHAHWAVSRVRDVRVGTVLRLLQTRKVAFNPVPWRSRAALAPKEL